MFSGCMSFRKRRLIHKLRRYRGRRQLATAEHSATSSHPSSSDYVDFLQLLDSAQLHLLDRAVESGGRESSDCIVAILSTCAERRVMMVASCYRHFRCGDDKDDLNFSHDLRHLPPPGKAMQDRPDDDDSFCLNPYHYFILVPQPRLNVSNRTEKIASDATSCASLTNDTGFCTAGTSTDECHGSHDACDVEDGVTAFGEDMVTWCQIAYWECDNRVGRLTAVSKQSVSVTTDGSMEALPSSIIRLDGFWSECSGIDVSSTVLRCRQSIGLGLTLYRTDEREVWLYNRSDHPLFFNSSSIVCDGPEDRVRKLSTGRSVRIYKEGDCSPPPPPAISTDGSWSIEPSSNNCHDASVKRQDTVVSTHDRKQPPTASISFGKGWGFNYKRSFNTSCPCWIEVIFSR